MAIEGEILSDEVLPPGAPWAARIGRGDVLRIVDLEGRQGVDFLCYNAASPEERYHAPNTLKGGRHAAPRQGPPAVLRRSPAAVHHRWRQLRRPRHHRRLL